MTNIEAVLRHGLGTQGPFCDETVDHKETKAPSFYSASGYGSKIPTRHMVKWRNKWRRVYAICWSNVSTLYIKHGKDRIILNLY